jgi:hypothetical protein
MDGKCQPGLEEETEGEGEEKEGEQEEGEIFFDDSSLGMESQQTKEADEDRQQHLQDGEDSHRQEQHEREVDDQYAGEQDKTTDSSLGAGSQQVETGTTYTHVPQSTQQSDNMRDNTPPETEESLSLPSDAIEGMEDSLSISHEGPEGYPQCYKDGLSISQEGVDEGRDLEGARGKERDLNGEERDLEEVVEEMEEEGIGDEEAEMGWDQERMMETAETMDPEALDALGESVEEEKEGVEKPAGREGTEVFVMTGVEEGEAADEHSEDANMVGTAKGEKEKEEEENEKERKEEEKKEEEEEEEEVSFDDSSLGFESQQTKEADDGEEQHLAQGDDHQTEVVGLAVGMVAGPEAGGMTANEVPLLTITTVNTITIINYGEYCPTYTHSLTQRAHQADQTLELDKLRARCVLAVVLFISLFLYLKRILTSFRCEHAAVNI